MSAGPRSRIGRQPLAAAAVLAMTVALALPAAADHRDDGQAGSGVVVKLASGASIDDLAAAHGLRVRETLLGSGHIHLVDPADGRQAEDLVESLGEDRRTLWAEPNLPGQIAEADPRMFGGDGSLAQPAPFDRAAWARQPAVAQVGLDRAHHLSTGAGVTVAVLDTGVDVGHPLLSDEIVAGYDYVADRSAVSDPANGRDDDGNGAVDEAAGHGTHVAGIVRLVAPDAAIMPLRVLDDEGHGWSFMTAQAIQHAVAAGARVVVASLGIDIDSEVLSDAVEDAAEAGVVVVAAAGNRGGTAPQWPAADEDAIAVAASDGSGGRASFSDSGPWVHIAAPGTDVLSAYPTSRLARWDGTSMATPFVGGQAALLLATGSGAERIAGHIVDTGIAIGDGLRAIDIADSLTTPPAGSTGNGDEDNASDDTERDD